MGHVGARRGLTGFYEIGPSVNRRLGVHCTALFRVFNRTAAGERLFQLDNKSPLPTPSPSERFYLCKYHQSYSVTYISLLCRTPLSHSIHTKFTPVPFRHNPQISGNNFAARLGPCNLVYCPSVPSSSHTVHLLRNPRNDGF